MPLQRTTIYLDPALWKRVRLTALREGCSASTLVATVLTAYLKRGKPRGR